MWINQAQDISGWSYIPPMSGGIGVIVGVAALGGKLYAVDADSGQNGEVYDPIDNSWTDIAPMSTVRVGVGVAALGGKLYAVGGANTAWLKSAEVYDPSDNSWTDIAPMNTPRNWFGVAALGGKLYAVGGLSTPPPYGITSAEVYDPIENSWTHIASTGTPGRDSAAALGGRLYALGGGSPHASAEVYDPIDNSWTDIASMSTPRYGLGVAALGGRLYAVGGANTAVPAATATAEVYDPMDNSWTDIASMSIPRYEVAVGSIGGRLYAVGGTGAPAPTAEAYDPSLVQMPQITHQGEDFYLSHQRGGPKTFIIPHPEPKHEGKMLRHACVEAPTRGTNIYEYQIEVKEDNGTTKIALPSYFKHLNDDSKVLITPHNVQCRFYGTVNKELTHVNVTAEKAGIFNVMVSGIRKDATAVAYSSTKYIDEPIVLEDIPK